MSSLTRIIEQWKPFSTWDMTQLAREDICESVNPMFSYVTVNLSMWIVNHNASFEFEWMEVTKLLTLGIVYPYHNILTEWVNNLLLFKLILCVECF